jgi:MFS family permease
MGSVDSVRLLVPLLIAFSFLADLYRPASSAMVADLLPSQDRAVGYAALRLAVNLGFGLGVALGGVLADVNWRLLFWGDGATTLAFGLIAWSLVRETQPDAPARADPLPAASPWRDTVFLKLLAATFIFCLAFLMDFFVLPLTVTETAGYPARVYGLLVGLNGLLIALFELSVVDWLGGFRRLRVAALGIVFTAVGMGLTGLVMHWAWFLMCVLLWTAGEILTIPQQSAFLADWAPPEARGRYLGIASASWGLGSAVAPIVFMPIHARLPEWAFWALLGLVVLPAAPLMLSLDRGADRPERLRGRATA